ncbi:MAG TPA: hypothetical protein DCR07_03275, partial [Lactococcus sp.]|nr:hypothetical protein [Lactococcus sp.]
MGGIMYKVIVNQDKELTLDFDIDKQSEGLKNGGVVISEKLSELLEK